MGLIKCRVCGRVFNRSNDSAPAVCRDCRSIHAIEDLLARLKEIADLPPDLREETERGALLHLLELRKKAPPPEPEAPSPPPEPPPEPPPLPMPDIPPPAAPPAEEKPREKKPPTGPTIWTRLGPIFAENLLFCLAAFLLVAGAIFFLTTAWTTMTGAERLLVVVTGIELLGGLLYAGGHLIGRAEDLPEVQRALFVATAFLAPVAGAAAGELLGASDGGYWDSSRWRVGHGSVSERCSAVPF